jgi:hypothetical protein
MTNPLPAAEIEALEALLAKATPLENATLTRYEHGGGRLFVEGVPPKYEGRDLIADFYDEGNREAYYALMRAAPALLAALRASEREREALEKRPIGWEWVHERDQRLIGEHGWMCEDHPGFEQGHGGCTGAGRSWMVTGRSEIRSIIDDGRSEVLNRVVIPEIEHGDNGEPIFVGIYCRLCHGLSEPPCLEAFHEEGCPLSGIKVSESQLKEQP